MKVFDFLSDSVSGADIVIDKSLPLVHTTKYQDFKEETFPAKNILKQMKLRINDEHLLYFFYARPARRFKNEKEIPVVLIIEPILKDIHKVYPFDTGAFDKYIENNRLDSRTPMSDYELSNNLIAIQQYINAIFGNNYNYYYGKHKTDDELSNIVKQCRKTNPDLNNLLNLINEKKEDGIDDRCKTIEIQSANDYNLSGKLLAIVVPNFCQNDKEFIKIIKKINVALLCYEYYSMSKLYDHREIYKCVKKYYDNQGYITSGGNYDS